MAWIRGFGSYLPDREVTNAEISALCNCDAEWIWNVSGIESRRFAAPDQTVVDLAVRAAQDCLSRSGATTSDIGMLIVASGSAPRRFPGPAVTIAQQLGVEGVPAIDLPIASAGSLFGLALASQLAGSYGEVLVIGAERMSDIALSEPIDRSVAVLFGDGAGASLVSAHGGVLKIVDSALHSDGAYSEDLRLEFGSQLTMNGRSVILQASRKVPRVIGEVLERNQRKPEEVQIFLMHQANQNLILRIAQALGVLPERFYSNIARYGNTSSASILIAAAEWSAVLGDEPGGPVVFSAFGAGFHWGALLAVP
jgi:3-oxoacyl-[acyl-carrier-protein] synthase-3